MKTFVLMMVSLLFAISSEAQNKSFYDFTVKTIDGKDFPLSSLKGKKVLVVNVASKCGLTSPLPEAVIILHSPSE